MRDPRERISDRRRIDLFGQEQADEAIELMVADDVQRRRGNVISLLIARGDQARVGMDANKRHAQAPSQHRDFAPVWRDAQHRAVVLARGRTLLAAFGNDERAVWSQPYPGRELARLSGLRESVREQLVRVRFAVPVRVPQSPEAVSVEDKQVVAASANAQGLVKPGRKAPPGDRVQILTQARYLPHVAIKGDCRRPA